MEAAAGVDVRDLTADEADGLVACVRRCYGETYPDALFYDAALLAAALREGRLFSKVAVTGEGRIVGHLGIRWLFPGDCVGEAVAGFVDPDFRGRGVLRAVGGALVDVYREVGLSGLWNFATGAHLRPQKMLLAAGARPTGLLLGHLPAGTDYRGIGRDSGSARIAAVVFHQPLAPAPALAIRAPEPYRELLRGLYGSLALQRTELEADPAAPPAGTHQLNQKRGASQLRFGPLAGAAPRGLDRLLEDVTSAGAPVVYADVPLCESGASALVERLRAEGFWFGALLPGSERSETLRLQRLSARWIDPERIAVGSESVAALLEVVLSDRAAVGDAPG
jgi:GNAT superfamily N-acetyltransferase